MTWLQGFIWFQQKFIFSWYPEVRRLFVEISPVYNKFTVIVKGNLRERVPPNRTIGKEIRKHCPQQVYRCSNLCAFVCYITPLCTIDSGCPLQGYRRTNVRSRSDKTLPFENMTAVSASATADKACNVKQQNRKYL